MSSCCICFNEILELSNWEYQCQTCNSGIICYMCFRNISKTPSWLSHIDNKDKLKKILCCPCCRQVNWKRLHNEVVNNIYYFICDKKIYSPAQAVFLQNYMLIRDDEAYEYSDSEGEDNFREKLFPVKLRLMLQRRVLQN